MTDRRSEWSFPSHSESSRAYGICACVSWPPWLFTGRPCLSTHLLLSASVLRRETIIPYLLRRIFLRLPAIGGNGVPNLICDASTRSSSSENNHSQILKIQVA